MGTYSAPDRGVPSGVEPQLYTQEMALPAKASVKEAVLYDRPFLPPPEEEPPPVLGVELETEDAVGNVPLAALEPSAELAMVANVVGKPDIATDDGDASGAENEKPPPPPPLDGLPKNAPAVGVPAARLTEAEDPAKPSSSPVSSDGVEELEGAAMFLPELSVTGLASGVAVTVTNSTVVLVMVEIKPEAQAELILDKAGALAAAGLVAAALATTGTLEKAASEPSSVDDSKGIGLTVTVMTAVTS